MLDDLGLLPALLWHVERFSTQTNVKVDLRHSGLAGRFGLEVETAAHRIVQEALTNVARHAGVDQATVRIWFDGKILGVQVEDRGAGFNAGLFFSFHLIRYYLILMILLGFLLPPLWLLSLRVLLIATTVDYTTRRPKLSYPVYLSYYVLEHLAYQLGVAFGCLRNRKFGSYVPVLTVGRPRSPRAKRSRPSPSPKR